MKVLHLKQKIWHILNFENKLLDLPSLGLTSVMAN